ncbi:thioredoxin family protein [Pueribacillus theae]|uniref:Thioredoxin family protein n=1 Tax=Pueribacillus theae TaxID=2171751 RepID=A0A2U1JZZ4_9BACI|nr:thioredoxin family protein [Pueribacillus theae]PWA10343.1 thioredoxin family protein [Pueribacillus theae]
MKLSNWFEKGMDAESYIDSMETHKDNLLSIYNRFNVREEDSDLFKRLKEKKIRVIVLTEDWCGDAMLNVPILLKIAEKSSMDVRMLLRDSNLELMDQYLTNGTSRAIPIFIFIDKEGNEKAVWGPRAPKVQAFVDDERAKLPPKEDEQFEEKQKAMYKNMTATFASDENVWNQVYESIIDKLKTV